MGFNAARGYPGQGDRRHGAARPVERKLGPSRATVGARLKMTFTSHLGPAGAGVQQQHRQESQDSQPRPPAPGARLRRHSDPGRLTYADPQTPPS